MFHQIKSNFILKRIFNNVLKEYYMRIIYHNIKLQRKLSIFLTDYMDLSKKIIIEIIPKKEITYRSLFINYCSKESDYHIHFEGVIDEIKRNYLEKGEKVSKIKVTIDKDIKSLNGLFKYCGNIEKINFIFFHRNDFKDMSNLFTDCTSLINVNVSKIKTDSCIFNEIYV